MHAGWGGEKKKHTQKRQSEYLCGDDVLQQCATGIAGVLIKQSTQARLGEEALEEKAKMMKDKQDVVKCGAGRAQQKKGHIRADETEKGCVWHSRNAAKSAFIGKKRNISKKKKKTPPKMGFPTRVVFSADRPLRSPTLKLARITFDDVQPLFWGLSSWQWRRAQWAGDVAVSCTRWELPESEGKADRESHRHTELWRLNSCLEEKRKIKKRQEGTRWWVDCF